MKLTWSPLARERVSEIAEYIAQDKPTAAEKWVNKIFNLVGRLSEFPESGRVVPEMNNKMFREIISGNYRIIYKHEKSTLLILTVRHGKHCSMGSDSLIIGNYWCILNAIPAIGFFVWRVCPDLICPVALSMLSSAVTTVRISSMQKMTIVFT